MTAPGSRTVSDRANNLSPGFGVTTQIINGGVECGGTVEVAQSKNRMSYYRSFAGYLNVPIAASEVLGCRGMKQFSSEGSGALAIYWEQGLELVAGHDRWQKPGLQAGRLSDPVLGLHAGGLCEVRAEAFRGDDYQSVGARWRAAGITGGPPWQIRHGRALLRPVSFC